jgi:hypothetical protein
MLSWRLPKSSAALPFSKWKKEIEVENGLTA